MQRNRAYSCEDIFRTTVDPARKNRRSSMPAVLLRKPPTPNASFYDNNTSPTSSCYYYPEQVLDTSRQSSDSRKSSDEAVGPTPSWIEIKSQYQLVTDMLAVVDDTNRIALERKRALKLWTRKVISDNGRNF